MNRKIIGLVIVVVLVLSTFLISGCVEEEKPSTESEVTTPTTEEEPSIIDKVIEKLGSKEKPEPYIYHEGITAVWSHWHVSILVTVENRGGAGIIDVTFQAEDQGVQTKYIYLDKGEMERLSFKIHGVGWQWPRHGERIEYNVTASPAPVVYIQGKPGQDYIPGLSHIKAKGDIHEGGTRTHTITNIWEINNDGSNQKQLTDDQPSVLSPFWSPDREKIAFVSARKGSNDIWIMDRDGNNQNRLTTLTRNEEHPSWSPDGRRLAFISHDSINFDLRAINSDGSYLETLTTGGLVGGRLVSADGRRRPIMFTSIGGPPSWSPDGGKIAFTHSNTYTIWPVSSEDSLWVIDSDGSNLKQLTTRKNEDISEPSWSPDGKKIVFVLGGDVWVIDADGSNQEQLTMSEVDERKPSWSPDGQKITFISREAGISDIWIMDDDGRNQKQLTTNRSNDRDPAWSPDGKKIAFTSDRAGNDDIWIVDSDGSNLKQLTTQTADDGFPVWSPDGRKIAFVSQERYSEPTFGGVAVDVIFFDEKDRILAFEDISVDVTVKLYTQRQEDFVSPEGERGFRYVEDRLIYAETVTIDRYKDASSRIGGEEIRIPFDVSKLKDAKIVEVIVHTSKGDFKDEYRI